MKPLILFLCCTITLVCAAKDDGIRLAFNEKVYAHLKQNHGEQAEQRAHKLQTVINNNQSESDWYKIHKINHFINRHIQYQEDPQLWGQKDYWASPIETLGQGKGDCEDYAIIKYFTLRALGVAENKLRLMYVRHLTLNQPHMVLIYFDKPDAMPLVLDNFNNSVRPKNERDDLKPVYSFNNEGLWLAKDEGFGRKIINSRGVSGWSKLLLKIQRKNSELDIE